MLRQDVDAALGFEIAAMMVDAPHQLFLLLDRFEIDHREVAALGEAAVLVEHIGDAARHAGGEVAPGLAEHDDEAAGHVFAAVVAGAFDHRDGAGIAHREALARDAAEIGLAGDRAVQHRVADDDGALRHGLAASATAG